MNEARVRRAAVRLANLLVPGVGFVLLGRVGVGVLWAAVWVVAVGGWLAIVLLRPDLGGTLWAPAFGVTAVLWYLFGQTLLSYWLRAADRGRADPARDARFRDALVAYLRGELDASESIARELLRADPDDVEAMLHLATLARHRGNVRSARRCLRRARYLDDAGRWDFRISRDLAALEARSP